MWYLKQILNLRVQRAVSCVLTAMLVFILSGCSTILSGAKENIFIRTEEAGSKIFVNDRYLAREAGTLSLDKKENYVIRVKKPGCKDGIMAVGKITDFTTFLGLPLFPVSILLVDWAMTGAVSKFSPLHYTVNPECPDAPNVYTANQAQTINAQRVPNSQEQDEAGMFPNEQNFPTPQIQQDVGQYNYDLSNSYEAYGISNYPTGQFATEF